MPTPVSNENIEKYVEKILPIITKVVEERGYQEEIIPAIIAQSSYETSGGTSNLVLKGHNLFGIRIYSRNEWKGGSYNSVTGEVSSTTPAIQRWDQPNSNANYIWRAYEDDEAGINGYFDYLEARGLNVKNCNDPYIFLDNLNGYSVNSSYVGTVKAYITEHNINEYISKYSNPKYTYINEPISSIENSNEFSNEVLITNFDVVNSNISATLKSLNSNKPNIDNKLEVSDITNTTFTNELTCSLNVVNSINTALGDKINYELCTLLTKISNQTKQMDNTLSELANTLSNGNGSASTINEIIDNSSTEVKKIFDSISNKGILSVTARNTDFGVVSLSGIETIVNSTNDSIDKSSAYLLNNQNVLSNFSNDLSSSGMIESGLWYVVNAKIENYNELLGIGITSLSEYKNAVQAAGKIITDFIRGKGYIKLDSSRRPELEEKITELKADNISKQGIVDSQHKVIDYRFDPTYGKQVECGSHLEPSEDHINYLKAIIDSNKQQIKAFEEEIAAIDEFPNVLNSAAQIINDALSSLYSKYGTAVNNLNVGIVSSYIPPSNTSFSIEIPKNEIKNPTATPKNIVQLNGETSAGEIPSYDETSTVKETNNEEDETKIKNQTDTTKETNIDKEEIKDNNDTKKETNIDKEEIKDNNNTKEESKKDETIIKGNTNNISEKTNTTASTISTSNLSNSVSKNINSRVNSGGSSSTNNSVNKGTISTDNNETNNPTITVENDDVVIIEPSITIPINDIDTTDKIVPIDSIVDTSTTITSSNNSSSNVAKTMGTLAAAGAAVGAASFGAYTYMKSKENKEENENYE